MPKILVILVLRLVIGTVNIVSQGHLGSHA